MGSALEIIGGSTTAPSTTETTLTPFSGNSYTVRSFKEGSKAFLIGAWSFVQGAGIRKIRSARMHDNSQGLRSRTLASDVRPFLAGLKHQELYSNDLLIDSLSGSASAGDIECGYQLIYYDDLPGINANFIDPATLNARGVNILSVEQQLTAGTTGGWSGQQTIVADFDLLKADIDYAIIGYTINTLQGAIRIMGSDSGNLGIGGPGDNSGEWYTKDWFIRISEKFGKPLIPVFNANNKNNILVDVSNNENAASPVFNLILVELSGK